MFAYSDGSTLKNILDSQEMFLGVMLTANFPTAQFAQHHVWVTKHRDGELWAGGEFTNQSQTEVDGVADVVARNENVENEDVVVWITFGHTHNPRVEDW